MAGTFYSDIGKFAKKFGMTMDEAHRGIAIKLFSSVVLDTPVDEGTLRANWNISGAQPNEKYMLTKKDPSGATTVGLIRSFPMQSGEVTTLANGMPYATVAEYGLWSTGNADSEKSKVTTEGYSKKSPAGMVRRNVARIQKIVRDAVSTAKRKTRSA